MLRPLSQPDFLHSCTSTFFQSCFETQTVDADQPLLHPKFRHIEAAMTSDLCPGDLAHLLAAFYRRVAEHEVFQHGHPPPRVRPLLGE